MKGVLSNKPKCLCLTGEFLEKWQCKCLACLLYMRVPRTEHPLTGKVKELILNNGDPHTKTVPAVRPQLVDVTSNLFEIWLKQKNKHLYKNH